METFSSYNLKMSGYRGGSVRDGQVYVGNLPPDIRTRDLEDLFYKYGKINFINLKDKNGPPFAFIEFDDPRDAEDAVRDRDGYDYDGYSLRVEWPHGEKGSAPTSRGRGGGFGGSYGGGRSRGGGGGYVRGRPPRGPPPGARRSDYRILVTGLPPSGSWQDLKDHMREAGDICYADVFNDGTGAVEFIRYDDMKYAVKHLNDTKFKSHEGETTYITVKEDHKSKDRSRSKSRSRSRSRSPRRRSRGSKSRSPAKR